MAGKIVLTGEALKRFREADFRPLFDMRSLPLPIIQPTFLTMNEWLEMDAVINAAVTRKQAGMIYLATFNWLPNGPVLTNIA